MYDKFEPFYKVDNTTFTFTPSRYEIWFEGKMINSGKSTLPIYFIATEIDDEDKMRVTIYDYNLFNEIEEKPVFDVFMTAGDRLQLLTLPDETDTTCGGIIALKGAIGATRHHKNFKSNEPYCCNLFWQGGKLVKITFSFSNPEKLIEFYI